MTAPEHGPRADLVETCRRLHARDLIGAGEGNVSVRLRDGRFLVTPSGANKGYLAAGDLVVVDAAGAVLDGGGRASTELRMHLAAYAARPDVLAVAREISFRRFRRGPRPPPRGTGIQAAIAIGLVGDVLMH